MGATSGATVSVQPSKEKNKKTNDDNCGCHFSLLIQWLPHPRHRRWSQQWSLVLFVLITAILQYQQSTQLTSWVTAMMGMSHSSPQNPPASTADAVALEEAPVSSQRRHRIVMAQYTGRPRIATDRNATNDTYERFLALTSRINIAYAQKWGYDYWILRGLPFSGPHLNATYTLERHVVKGQLQEMPWTDLDDTRGTEEQDSTSFSRATYNKLTLLELALQQQDVDGILILDADAMMYDFSRDIADLLSSQTVLVAHSTASSTNSNSTSTNANVTTTNSGSINVGVTLWNIRHPLAPLVFQRWRDRCVRRILDHPDKMDDDQAPLQHILKYELNADRRSRVVTALEGKEFHYASGTLVRHFIRPAGSTWSTADGDALRLEKMQRSIAEVCQRYKGVCDESESTRHQ